MADNSPDSPFSSSSSERRQASEARGAERQSEQHDEVIHPATPLPPAPPLPSPAMSGWIRMETYLVGQSPDASVVFKPRWFELVGRVLLHYTKEKPPGQASHPGDVVFLDDVTTPLSKGMRMVVGWKKVIVLHVEDPSEQEQWRAAVCKAKPHKLNFYYPPFNRLREKCCVASGLDEANGTPGGLEPAGLGPVDDADGPGQSAGYRLTDLKLGAESFPCGFGSVRKGVLRRGGGDGIEVAARLLVMKYALGGGEQGADVLDLDGVSAASRDCPFLNRIRHVCSTKGQDGGTHGWVISDWIPDDLPTGGVGEDAARHLTAQLAVAIEALEARGLAHGSVAPHKIRLDAGRNLVLTGAGVRTINTSVRRREPALSGYHLAVERQPPPAPVEVDLFYGDDRERRSSQPFAARSPKVNPNAYAFGDDWWSLGAVLYYLVAGGPPRWKAAALGDGKGALHARRGELVAPVGASAACKRCLAQLLGGPPAARPRGIRALRRLHFFAGVEFTAESLHNATPAFQPAAGPLWARRAASDTLGGGAGGDGEHPPPKQTPGAPAHVVSSPRGVRGLESGNGLIPAGDASPLGKQPSRNLWTEPRGRGAAAAGSRSVSPGASRRAKSGVAREKGGNAAAQKPPVVRQRSRTPARSKGDRMQSLLKQTMSSAERRVASVAKAVALRQHSSLGSQPPMLHASPVRVPIQGVGSHISHNSLLLGSVAWLNQTSNTAPARVDLQPDVLSARARNCAVDLLPRHDLSSLRTREPVILRDKNRIPLKIGFSDGSPDANASVNGLSDTQWTLVKTRNDLSQTTRASRSAA